MSLFGVLAQGVLSQVTANMGPQGSQLARAALQMLAQQGQGQSGAGLNNIAAAFDQNGLGAIMKSWVGTGANMPINPQQILQALGQGNVQSIAQQAGLSPDQASTQLSKLLPDLINQMTPNGKIEDGIVGEVMQAFLGQKAA